MTAPVTSREKRQARAFLHNKDIRSHEISPSVFAVTAKRMNMTFSDLLVLLAKMKTGGQGQGQSEIAENYS